MSTNAEVAKSRHVIMMAKAPVPGQVKTRLRLAPTIAAELAGAFIDDTWRSLGTLVETKRSVAYAGPKDKLPACLQGARCWPQVSGDLGAKIEAALRRGLEHAARVIAIGSDAPAIPSGLLDAAFAALADHDAVIGPACDGGYVLIGMTRCDPGILEGLPWSQPDTALATVARLRERGLRVAELPYWFDVDEPEDLPHLRAAMAAGWIDASSTEDALARLP